MTPHLDTQVVVGNTIFGKIIICEGRTGVLLQVHITIHNINDCPPVFVQRAYAYVISESAPISTVVGAVAAVDRDTPTNQLRYGLRDAPTYVDIDEHTGALRVRTPLDADTIDHVHLIATVTDGQFEAEVSGHMHAHTHK
jgi:hypothetical protein